MNAWWKNRTTRERQYLLVMLTFIVALATYLLIIKPTSTSLSNLEADTQYNKELVYWLKQQKPIIESLRQTQSPHLQSHQASLFSILETTFTKNHFKTYQGELSAINPNQVSVKFSKVPFERLVVALDQLNKQYGVQVVHMQADTLDTVGLVEVTTILEKR